MQENSWDKPRECHTHPRYGEVESQNQFISTYKSRTFKIQDTPFVTQNTHTTCLKILEQWQLMANAGSINTT